LYDLVERSQRIPLLRVRADVRARAAGPGLPPSAVAPA
jgi:hypothetical protein